MILAYVIYYRLMVPPSYMLSVVERNVVMRRILVLGVCVLRTAVCRRRNADTSMMLVRSFLNVCGQLTSCECRDVLN